MTEISNSAHELLAIATSALEDIAALPQNPHDERSAAAQRLLAQNALAQMVNLNATSKAQKKPETMIEWARHDGTTAYHLIDSHSNSWLEAGAMMETWGKARYGNAGKAEQLVATFEDLQCKVCGDNISLQVQREMVLELVTTPNGDNPQ